MRRTVLALAAALAMLGGGARAAMRLSSPDLPPGGQIPPAQVYPRCGGRNISPALAWSGTPAGAKSLVLTVIDLDAKPALWSHWIVVDLPPSATGLPRGASRLPAPARAVAGNFGDAAYDGPCPPKGSGVHQYQFTIWAMPAASTAIAPDSDARAIAPMLARTALAHASLTGWAER